MYDKSITSSHPATVERICEHCDSHFRVSRAAAMTGSARFCSDDCRAKHRRTGSAHPNYQKSTGRFITDHGYVMVRIKGEWMYEHRYVMEQMIGRPLKRGEEVHHKDLDKQNNEKSNLELYGSKSEHMKNHANNPNGIGLLPAGAPKPWRRKLVP